MAGVDACSSAVELFVDGAWENITRFVYHRDQTVTARGRREESDTSDPATCAVTLNNDDGRFSHRNPTGPYYGSLTRNTPIRSTVHAGLRAAVLPPDTSITAPHDASFAITGDLDVRIDVEPAHWRQEHALAARYEITGNHRSWAVYVDVDGTIWLLTSPDGTLASRLSFNSGTPVPFTGGRHAVRVTIDVNNGSGGKTVTWYTADTIAGPWTQLVQRVYTGTTSIHGGTAPIEVGDIGDLVVGSLDGRVYGFELLDGIGGTPVADLDTTLSTTTATAVVDGEGHTWTAGGDGVFTRAHGRFHGEVAAWPQTWDDDEKAVHVQVEAAGVLRRLRQSDAAESTIRRAISEDTAVFVYWPAEDEQDSTQVAAAGDHRQLTVTEGEVEFAADSEFVASKPLPTMNDAELKTRVPEYDHTTGQVQYRALLHVDEAGSVTGQTFFEVYTTGTARRWEVAYGTGGDLRLRAFDDDDTQILTTGFISFAVDGAPCLLHLQLVQNGGNIDYALSTLSPGAASASTFTGTLNSRTFERVWQTSVNPAGGHENVAFGHIHLANQVTTLFDFAAPLAGHTGETAADRFLRLCDENSIAGRVIGVAGETTVMGPQRPQPLAELLDEVEAADGGLLVEARDRLGVNYRTRRSLYNQVAVVDLDCCDGTLGGPLQPVDDDAAIRNDVTVARVDGSSARSVQNTGVLSVEPPPDGAGRYTTSVDVNVRWDEQLEDEAGWRLHLGTVDEPRFPAIDVAMLNPLVRDDAALLTAMLAVDVGDRATVSDVQPVWLGADDVDQIVEGTTEVFSDFADGVWTVGLRCQPASRVAVATYGGGYATDRYGGGWSTLAAGVNDVATSLSVATSRGPLWTVVGGEFPFTIVVGGEEMTVTGITGGSSPQSFTVTRSSNGVVKSHSAGAPVMLADVAVRGL